MDSFEKKLYKASLICSCSFKYLTDWSLIYTFTTENIDGYIKYFDLNNKSLLTVGSSGDQILNAFFYGARDITLYDINPYAKYYVYLKVAAILSLDYIEFQEFFFKHGIEEYYNKKMFSKILFNKIKTNLRLFDYESFLFFDELFSCFDGDIIRGYLFNDDLCNSDVIKNFNIYLRDEDCYNKLKSIIKKISFKYINGDIFEDNILGQYDNIFLSNLCTITSVNKIKELLDKLDRNNIKLNGSVLIGYLWNTNFDLDEFSDDWKEIYKLPLSKEILNKFITDYYQINGERDCIWKEDQKRDLVLVYRKTK